MKHMGNGMNESWECKFPTEETKHLESGWPLKMKEKQNKHHHLSPFFPLFFPFGMGREHKHILTAN